MKIYLINLTIGFLLLPFVIHSIYIADYLWSFVNSFLCILNIGIGVNYFNKEGEKKDV